MHILPSLELPQHDFEPCCLLFSVVVSVAKYFRWLHVEVPPCFPAAGTRSLAVVVLQVPQ